MLQLHTFEIVTHQLSQKIHVHAQFSAYISITILTLLISTPECFVVLELL